MAANHKSIKQTTISFPKSHEYRLQVSSPRMIQTKPRTPSSNRLIASKSSLNYPTMITRSTTSFCTNYSQYQQDARFLYVVNKPEILRHTTSSGTSNTRLQPLLFHQQSTTSSSSSPPLPRTHPQYGHFLAYLRRQSLARLRRKQEEKEENTDHVDTTISFNSNKTTAQSFNSTSNMSLGTTTSETTSMPTISLTSKQKGRPVSSYNQLQRSSSVMPTNYRLSLDQSPPIRQNSSTTKKISDNHVILSPSKSNLITPTNSLVDETMVSSTEKIPYELKLNGDMLSYCYVSDSGVTYQGQLLSTPV
ncbi:unnamed protein product [Adineta steineri]|uniref:Uncharacterized protein n=1 Tax=Adineta steineri TaxID=433720 RepID=A0A815BW74_9BILA|nr:unnamed protein product [Adineta steineri]CAF1246597.1 unnamed protein product [Adineta steineri]CAF1275408.1 unnamed protein product [Adineta steineri]